MLPVVLLEVMLQASKTHPSPHRNTMLLKDGTTSKNMLPPGLDVPSDSIKNTASSAAGLAGPAGPAGPAAAAACCCYCCCCCSRCMLLVVLLEVVLQASKTHPSPHRNTMLLKDPICVACCNSLYRHGQKHSAEALTNEYVASATRRATFTRCNVRS